mgnify:CR=1 FL=1
MRPLLIGFFVCINIHFGYAQWTEQDSIWLKDVLAGKDSIKLNPEFQKAIQSGSFLNPEPGKPMGKPQLAAPSNIPITKGFQHHNGSAHAPSWHRECQDSCSSLP